ncbi:hypothetical protein SARC_03233 [Sphaeroforma arctica JP610]|uniref:Uncharacterized protein n=1 Tax=Sphaeroforma arctica JP610 TaxID=667725 RepID=A0A0L0G6C9_9EUKA|nr:hypothetical protein SARC_03233 [Sphaeroforma arctica JP610]KNC84560.1 hypothetical protein SARC_03233 [Sphaeroforma arctica JP610]|eukprot:XP_014158462.1 hypothetical protein SARC_03233 [Sphaeroforma arctica JP610]
MPSTKPTKGSGSPTKQKPQPKQSKKLTQAQAQAQAQSRPKTVLISKGPVQRQGSGSGVVTGGSVTHTRNATIQPSPHARALQHAHIQPQQHQKYNQHNISQHPLGIPMQMPPTISPGNRPRQPLPQTVSFLLLRG